MTDQRMFHCIYIFMIFRGDGTNWNQYNDNRYVGSVSKGDELMGKKCIDLSKM